MQLIEVIQKAEGSSLIPTVFILNNKNFTYAFDTKAAYFSIYMDLGSTYRKKQIKLPPWAISLIALKG